MVLRVVIKLKVPLSTHRGVRLASSLDWCRAPMCSRLSRTSYEARVVAALARLIESGGARIPNGLLQASDMAQDCRLEADRRNVLLTMLPAKVPAARGGRHDAL